ncbi:sugar phosphate isomerase/epimerase [Pirellulaceae bacterium]|jgi:sugar phosphate isomerase/epimerase|nr:sugar phosphate isomerase/epimerase [Pirellulaceae bacterium]
MKAGWSVSKYCFTGITLMYLSVSVRIVEATCKTKLNVPAEEFIEIVKQGGASAICMRASGAGVEASPEQLQTLASKIASANLPVTMVTADYDVPLNNAEGPNSLRNIRPSLDVAEAFDCDLIRVCMKNETDIAFARQAAELAAERGIRLAHQCHTSSLFEEVDQILDVLKEIDRDNFGIIYEPANLLLNGQDYGVETLQRLAPHIMNVYVQNHRLDPKGPEVLDTYCRGPVRFHHLYLWETGGVDFTQVFQGLRDIEYVGSFTIHQAQGIETLEAATEYVKKCRRFFRNQTGACQR